jgi:Icc protein
MLIAQITDVHIGFDQGNPDELNRRRLDKVLSVLCAMRPRPELLLVTGDLVDQGDDRISYGRLRDVLADCPIPYHLALGNHDGREAFREYFPEVPTADGFVQYAIEHLPVRVLVLDTLDEGRHSGAFCDTRAAWLEARLDEAPERPTMIVLHHPPIETGLAWMSENPAAEWVLRLEAIVAPRSNIVAMVAGHIHRPMTTRWAGTNLAVCASTAPQVALDFMPIDSEHPDDRPMIVADPPWFALHYWNGRQLISHFDIAADHHVLARYGAGLQPLVRMLKAEKSER